MTGHDPTERSSRDPPWIQGDRLFTIASVQERGEKASYARTLKGGGPFTKPFDPHWLPGNWTKWATIREAMRHLGVEDGASVLDVGCGEGWTSLFLAEGGYDVTGVDFAPAAVEMARERADRWRTRERPRFEVADMETFDLQERFDFALVFESLHHAERRAAAVARIASHLKPGAWVLFGEPSWLHAISPHARRTHREAGWVERGVPVRRLKAECRSGGLGDFRRFYEGTLPYERRLVEFGWQLVRLVAANVWVAPQACVWLAARRGA